MAALDFRELLMIKAGSSYSRKDAYRSTPYGAPVMLATGFIG
jgi:hypothetical protein